MRSFFILIILFVSINIFGQETITIKNTNQNSNPNDSDFYFTPKEYFYQYDSSLGNLSMNFDEGYIDTFSVGENKFRIRAADSSCCIVEKFYSKEWDENFSFDLSQYGYNKSVDINIDGYNDFVNINKWSDNVVFFDPRLQEFSEEEIVTEQVLLDTTKKIFCDFAAYNLRAGPAISGLYIFKNYQKVYLFNLKIIFDDNDENYTIKEEILYKGSGTTHKLSEIVPTQKTSVDDFDYEKFWRLRYNRLLGYH